MAIGNAPISADLGSIDILENSSRAGSKPDVWVCEWFVCCPVGQMKNLIWTGLTADSTLTGGETQAGMLTSPGDSAGIGLVFAAALMESETTQLAPANAMQIALPTQLK